MRRNVFPGRRISHWPARATLGELTFHTFSFLQNVANVYTINKSWLGLKSDTGSRVTLFDGRVIILASLLTVDLYFLFKVRRAHVIKKEKKGKKKNPSLYRPTRSNRDNENKRMRC